MAAPHELVLVLVMGLAHLLHPLELDRALSRDRAHAAGKCRRLRRARDCGRYDVDDVEIDQMNKWTGNETKIQVRYVRCERRRHEISKPRERGRSHHAI